MKKIVFAALMAIICLSSCEVEMRGDTRYRHYRGYEHAHYPEHHDYYDHGYHHDREGRELRR